MCSEAFQRHSDIPVNVRIAIYLVKSICTALSLFLVSFYFFSFSVLFSQVEIYFFKVLLPYELSPKAKTLLQLNYIIGLGTGQ